jgi:hypothetical protein
VLRTYNVTAFDTARDAAQVDTAQDTE